MTVPLFRRPELGRTTSRFNNGSFQFFAFPLSYCSGNVIPIGTDTEESFNHHSVGGSICMEPYPSISGLVVTSDRVPGRCRTPTYWFVRLIKPVAREAPVDREAGLGVTVSGLKLSNGKGKGGK